MGAATVVLAFPISYRDLALMLSDRGVVVDNTTFTRWVQAYAAKLEQRVRRHLRLSTVSWRVDETYIKVEGVWTHLHRVVDNLGQTIDFLLSVKGGEAAAAKRFVRKALKQPQTVNPCTVPVDKNPTYPRAVRDMKRAGGLWRFSRIRQCKYLNDIMEQDHRRIKRLVRPGLGFGSLRTAVPKTVSASWIGSLSHFAKDFQPVGKLRIQSAGSMNPSSSV